MSANVDQKQKAKRLEARAIEKLKKDREANREKFPILATADFLDLFNHFDCRVLAVKNNHGEVKRGRK